ncbi:pericentriolar material 1 protein-like isoform X7 [Mytilus californianus]|uniref:pericentriolar material 1 protein-like isoform X7 n=1 Tax=Mytilus californianus TaxID=6549 RepID=UPI002245BF50|nr:pericentriolar material 1 protein-like isoform X7 [Mytilus californianus]
MASGGGNPFRKPAATDPRQKSTWQRTASASDKDDNISLNSLPNDLRPNNWASLDGERNNERNVPIRRGRPPNFTRQDTSSTEGAGPRNDMSQQRGRNMASPNNVEDFFSEAGPNQGEIVGRLMQIRDYIKQANVMMDALNKSGNPQAHREDLGKLRKLADSLQEQENSYLGLLQQALTMKVENTAVDGRDDAPRPDSAEDRQSVDIDVKSESDETATERSPSASSRPRIEDKLGMSEDEDLDDGTSPFSVDRTLIPSRNFDQDNDVDEGDPEGDLMALRQQQELLQKLLQQKEQMTALKERQRSLIALQKDAEAKLNEARAYEGRKAASMNSLGGQQPPRQNRPAADNIFANVESDGTPSSLQDIRQHFNLLRNELKETVSAGSRKVEKKDDRTRPSNPAIEAAANEAAAALDDNRSQLQNKLEELHDKKQKMDQLLQELQILRSERVEDIMNNGLQDNSTSAAVPRTNSQMRISSSEAASQHAEATEHDAEDVLKMLEAEEKFRKLKEVKERLNQLKSLMQYYQAEEEDKENDERAAYQGRLEQGSIPVNNEQLTEVPVEIVRSGRGVETRSDDENESESSSNEEGTESHLSSLGPWGDDPEIQEKVKKLKAAKDKLKQLQDLVSMVQHSPDAAQLSLPENLMELAGSLDDGEYTEVMDKGTELSEGEIANDQEEERDTFYAAKMQEQMDELDELKSERQRLLNIQQELQTLNARFPTSEVAEGDQERDAEPTHKRHKQSKQIPDEPEVEGSDRAPVVTFSSNDEVYDKMRRQRMLREELRQKKREVEAIMKKDGSRKNYGKNQDAQSDTVSFSTDAFGGAASADATMATWGGSTVDNMESITEDGVDGNQASDNDEVDDGYPSDGIVQVEEEEEEFDNETYTIENDVRQRRMARAGKTKQRTYPRSRNEPKGGARPKQRSFAKKQKKSRQRQENFRSAEDIIQDDEPASLQQQIDRLTNLCQSLLQRDTPGPLMQPSPTGYGYQQNPDIQQQFQQQQSLMMNQCLQQMCMQQMELQNLQRQLNMFTDPYGGDMRLRSLQSLPTDSRNMSPNLESRQQPFSVQVPQFPSSYYGNRRSNDSSPQMNNEGLLMNRSSYGQGSGKKASSGRSKNNYEQYYSSEKKEKSPKNVQERSQEFQDTPMPLLNFDEQKNRRKLNAAKDWSTTSLASDSKHGSERPDREEDARRQGLSLRARQLLEDMYRPGLSAGISGAGFRENISIASTMSQAQESPGKDTRESDDGVDLSLFEALREGIYAEVATLISQNENRPHFLIELFRELQKLNTDYLRQRALYAIRDVGSKFLTEQNNDTSVSAPAPAWMNTDAVNQGSDTESTPSESIVTTDMDEITDAPQGRRTQLQNNMLLRGGSIANDAFDYIENADNDSSLSTPSNSYWENPFAQDSLGDTAINLNKALQKMRECEKKMASEEAKVKSLENARQNRELSEQYSSSAVDQGSDKESSVSSLSVSQQPKIDTQQVDRQIKSIMTEIIPVIKQHMDNVCSSELLTYIKRLVLSLTRQRDGSQYSRFYHTQLGSSLQDTLSKFEGRKMRDCGEDLLVDMSEVLFNELAFFKLMQGIVDVPSTSDQSQQTSPFKSSGTQTQEVEQDEEENDDEETDQTQESDTETTSSTAEEQAINTSIKMVENEEEELGKSRDDDFANEVQVKDSEDKDEDTESPYKMSPVQIELAVSETKPFTRIGSDEDDEDASESQSADDPSETAVSRDAMMERSLDNDDGTTDGMPDEDSFVKISKEDADQGANTSKDSKSSDTQCNGEVLMNGEITIDDLPPSLDICQGGIQQRVQQEQVNNSGTAAVLATMETEQELAGDGLFLKEPDELKME